MFRRKKPPAQQAPTKVTRQAAALQPAQHQASVARVPPRAPTLRRPLTIGECLEQLQGTLRRLRTLNPGDLQAFPLLNEAQRCMQQLREAASSLPPAEREAWAFQLSDLEEEFRELADAVVQRADAAPKPEPRPLSRASSVASSRQQTSRPAPSPHTQYSAAERSQHAEAAMFPREDGFTSRSQYSSSGVRQGSNAHYQQQQHVTEDARQPPSGPTLPPHAVLLAREGLLSEQEREALRQQQEALLRRHEAYLLQQRSMQPLRQQFAHQTPGRPEPSYGNPHPAGSAANIHPGMPYQQQEYHAAQQAAHQQIPAQGEEKPTTPSSNAWRQHKAVQARQQAQALLQYHQQGPPLHNGVQYPADGPQQYPCQQLEQQRMGAGASVPAGAGMAHGQSFREVSAASMERLQPSQRLFLEHEQELRAQQEQRLLFLRSQQGQQVQSMGANDGAASGYVQRPQTHGQYGTGAPPGPLAPEASGPSPAVSATHQQAWQLMQHHERELQQREQERLMYLQQQQLLQQRQQQQQQQQQHLQEERRRHVGVASTSSAGAAEEDLFSGLNIVSETSAFHVGSPDVAPAAEAPTSRPGASPGAPLPAQAYHQSLAAEAVRQGRLEAPSSSRTATDSGQAAGGSYMGTAASQHGGYHPHAGGPHGHSMVANQDISQQPRLAVPSTDLPASGVSGIVPTMPHEVVGPPASQPQGFAQPGQAVSQGHGVSHAATAAQHPYHPPDSQFPAGPAASQPVGGQHAMAAAAQVDGTGVVTQVHSHAQYFPSPSGSAVATPTTTNAMMRTGLAAAPPTNYTQLGLPVMDRPTAGATTTTTQVPAGPYDVAAVPFSPLHGQGLPSSAANIAAVQLALPAQPPASSTVSVDPVHVSSPAVAAPMAAPFAAPARASLSGSAHGPYSLQPQPSAATGLAAAQAAVSGGSLLTVSTPELPSMPHANSSTLGLAGSHVTHSTPSASTPLTVTAAQLPVDFSFALPSLDALPSASDVVRFLESVAGPVDACRAAAEGHVRQVVSDLSAALLVIQEAQAGMYQKRRAVKTALEALASSVAQLEGEQAAAAAAEDFDAAAAIDERLRQLAAQRGHLAESEQGIAANLAAASQLRLAVRERQLEAWSTAADYLARLQEGQQQVSAALTANAARQAQEALELHRSAQEAITQRRATLHARSEMLSAAKAEVAAKLATATAPAEEERAARESNHSALQAEVESLRALLATKEAALEAAAAALAEATGVVRRLASAFDSDVAALEQARAQLAEEEAQVEAQEAAVQESEQQAADRAAATAQQQEELRQQADALELAAADMRAAAGALASRIAAERQAQAQREQLRGADEAAVEGLAALQRCIADTKAELSRVLDKRSALQAEQAAAQHALAAVQLNLPHLEAAKRAAAANKDFKEAARLSGEIKMLSQQADATAQRLSGLGASMAELDGAEARLQGELQEMADMARQAERDAAEAHYRYTLCCLDLDSSAMEEATAGERYEDAGVIQAEVAAEEAELLTLERTWGFVRPTLGVASGSTGQLHSAGGVQPPPQGSVPSVYLEVIGQPTAAAEAGSAFATAASVASDQAYERSGTHSGASERVATGDRSLRLSLDAAQPSGGSSWASTLQYSRVDTAAREQVGMCNPLYSDTSVDGEAQHGFAAQQQLLLHGAAPGIEGGPGAGEASVAPVSHQADEQLAVGGYRADAALGAPGRGEDWRSAGGAGPSGEGQLASGLQTQQQGISTPSSGGAVQGDVSEYITSPSTRVVANPLYDEGVVQESVERVG